MARDGRLVDWRSGGGFLLLALLLVAVAAGWRILPWLSHSGRAVGDGRNVETYGFDLSDFALSRSDLVPAGFPRDGIPTLDAPATMPSAEVLAFNQAHRGKYLVSEDRVIGVQIGDVARAYPLRVLNWHEVINDTLGQVPIAVSYHPLCDAAVVFDRRVGDEILEFGVSGLLHNSNLLFYDRPADDGTASLWSQLLGRAVSGPRARETAVLQPLAASLTTWSTWLELHPAGDVIRPDPARLERYQRNPYGNYLVTGDLRYPVTPAPAPDGPAPMAASIAFERDGSWTVLPLDRLETTPGLLPAGVRLIPPHGDAPASIVVDPTRVDSPPRFGLWFALSAYFRTES